MHNIKIFLQFARYKIILALFFAFPSFAQQTTDVKKIDSLLQLVKVCKVDTTKVNLYFEICNIYSKTDYTKIDFYNQKILLLSKKINFSKGFGDYYLLKAIVMFLNNNYDKSLSNIAQSNNFYKKAKTTKNLLRLKYIHAFCVFKLGNSDKAEQMIVYELEKLNNKKNINYINFNYLLGCIYTSKNNFKLSLSYLFEAYKTTKALNESEMFLAVSNEILIIYAKTSRFIEAKEIGENAINIMLKNKYTRPKYANIYANTAANEYNLSNYNNALSLANQGLFLSRKYNINDVTSYLCNIKAIVNYELKNFKQAIVMTDVALQYSETTMTNQLAIEFKGKCYFEMKQFKQAQQYQLSLLESLKTSNQWEIFPNAYLDLSKSEFALKKYQEAYLHQSKYILNKAKFDSLYYDKSIVEMQTKYTQTENNLKIKNQQIQNSKQLIVLKKNKIVRGFQWIVIVFLLLIAIYILWMFKNNKKKNVVLMQTLKDLEASRKQIQLNLEVKNVLLKEVHHRVKNNLQLITSLLNIEAQQQNFTTIDNFIEKSQLRINSLSLVHENLCTHNSIDKVDFQQYVTQLTLNISKSIMNDRTGIQFIINTNGILLSIEIAISLGIIINELTTNAIKYAFTPLSAAKIEIELKETDGLYQFRFEDNGGANKQPAKKNNAVGLLLVQVLVKQLRGILTKTTLTGYRYDLQFPKIA